jgi:hypothetical protein
MKMQSLPVLSAVRAALKDGDPRVRAEAEQTLRQLGAENTGRAAPSMRGATQQ